MACKTSNRDKCGNKLLLKLIKRRYLPYYWSDKGFKGTSVNLTWPSLTGGWFEITRVDPSRNWRKKWIDYLMKLNKKLNIFKNLNLFNNPIPIGFPLSNIDYFALRFGIG